MAIVSLILTIWRYVVIAGALSRRFTSSNGDESMPRNDSRRSPPFLRRLTIEPVIAVQYITSVPQ
jgi:hypothetical protein